jgi:2,4-dienoyl-CoA reductase-like NADH-dependent reductase (Old Yellow Enzyme family)
MSDRANSPSDQLIRLYERWGKGGLGMIVTGNVMVDRRSIGEPRNVVIEDDRDAARLREWSAAIGASGSLAIVQLNHPGRQTLPPISSRVVGPSAVRVKIPGTRFPTPRALRTDEIEEQINRFATAAAVSVNAGFDGVQLHAAHGYLFSQFLSPMANVRDDEWGGDAVRRRRFLIETVRAVRARIGGERVLAVKLNSADFQRGGFDEDESLEVIRALEVEGIDLLEISGGTYARSAMLGQGGKQSDSTRAREAYFLEFAERVRASVELPLMITGGLRSAGAMSEALEAGIDVIGLGRPLTYEPGLAHSLLADPNARSSLKPVSAGIKQLNGAAELFWHSHQMHRMGAGKDPTRRLGGRRAIAMALVRDGVNALSRKRGG